MYLNPYLVSDHPVLDDLFWVVRWELTEHLGATWWKRQRLDKERALRNLLINLLVCTRTQDGFDEVMISMRPQSYVEGQREYPRHYSYAFYTRLAHALAETGWCILLPGFWDREGDFGEEKVRFRTRLLPTAKVFVFGSLHPVLARQGARPIWEVRDDWKDVVDIPLTSRDRRAIRELEGLNTFMANVEITLPAHLLDAKLVVDIVRGGVRNEQHLRWRWLGPCEPVKPPPTPTPEEQKKKRKKRRLSLRKRAKLNGSFIPLPYPLFPRMTRTFVLVSMIANDTIPALVNVGSMFDVARYLDAMVPGYHPTSWIPTARTSECRLQYRWRYRTTHVTMTTVPIDRTTEYQAPHGWRYPTMNVTKATVPINRTTDITGDRLTQQANHRTTQQESNDDRDRNDQEVKETEVNRPVFQGAHAGPLLVRLARNSSICLSLGCAADNVIRMDAMVRLQLYVWRVFNRGSTKFGGRFFHLLQSLPKEVRRLLRIGGEEVVELDYKGLHVVMLYHEKGLVAPTDPYAVFGDDRDQVARPLVKSAVLTMINAQGVKQLPNAVRFNFLKKYEWATGRTGVLNGITRRCGSVADIIEAIKVYHRPIAEHFNADVGVRLQRRDSEIMRIALKRCMALGIAAIPIHDSVVVARRHEQVVERIMRDAYREEMKNEIVVERT